MDYRHTMAKSLILCGPNSNPNPSINIWDLDIKAYFFVEIMVDQWENMDKGPTSQSMYQNGC